ncbi:hypothetical protein [Clostridium estertheticum]|uniref:hypothetical protein n=1 Tax=Clostridium estertheticum TaxID=238834 RepID=UPI00124C6D4E|nr:hypothetical protein [Clostridium estertheticum]MBX4259718.1 hypothetical protein [Clostridium estertheticum]MBZ9615278.1 hypothetical protein [Clostridium estertheticum subsp. laramiense]WAG75167.1 hypothetical protein LL032_06880 [Clostridium estertheticum]WLC73305.1 hypothetical protein KTC96_24650 [Clostridium estertheticum]
MNEWVKSLIIIACSIVGTIYGIKGYVRLTKKDIKDIKDESKKETIKETQSNTILETKMDYISKGIDDIKLDNRDQCRQLNVIAERVTRVEESTKSAHKRIDDIEK